MPVRIKASGIIKAGGKAGNVRYGFVYIVTWLKYMLRGDGWVLTE